MGNNSSRHSVASSVRKKLKWKPRRTRGHSDLSATFNMLDVNLHYEQLNINSATEEELMTLPGITRTIARNIIDYRQSIETFRKVEDLALVSGVGATKLELIRPEICVSRRRINPSQSSSLNVSMESIPCSVISNNHSTRTGSIKIVNINKANAFQLMSVRGIDQELAANILYYREKKGPFKTLDDLVKVKGIYHKTVGEFRQHLTVNADAAPIEYIPRTPQRTPQIDQHQLCVNHRRTKSMPPKCESPTCAIDINELYDILSLKSQRPVHTDMFSFRRNGKTALRLATWNLQQFIPDKADNPGVKEVICRTILENGISLISCQEVGDKEVLEKICSELNNPHVKKVQEWTGHQGQWECITSDVVGQMDNNLEFNGFIYDTSRGIELKESGIIGLSSKDNGTLIKKPFWAVFKVEKIEFTVICAHVALPSSHDHNKNHAPTELATKIKDLLVSVEEMQISDNLVILGDMNISPIEQEFNILRDKSFTHIVPVGTYTSAKCKKVISAEGKGFDNIWLSKQVYKYFTGHWGIVRQGLSHLAIPNGWTWGGVVSSHCPVWVEFYIPSQTDGLPNGKVSER